MKENSSFSLYFFSQEITGQHSWHLESPPNKVLFLLIWSLNQKKFLNKRKKIQLIYYFASLQYICIVCENRIFPWYVLRRHIEATHDGPSLSNALLNTTFMMQLTCFSILLHKWCFTTLVAWLFNKTYHMRCHRARSQTACRSYNKRQVALRVKVHW